MPLSYGHDDRGEGKTKHTQNAQGESRAGGIDLAKTADPRLRQLPAGRGVPVYRFRKQVIRLGQFTTADGHPFEVTPKTLRLWLSDFHRMQRNGVPVPVPNRHDATGADENHGFVVGMELSADGSGLDAILELFGADAPKIAASNHCSIYAEPGWTDGNRNQYRWPIRHVALTPDPRITGLKGFIPVAASNSVKKVPIARNTAMAKRRALKLDSEGNPMNVPGTGYGESPANDGSGVDGDPLDMILDAIEQESLPKIRSAKDKAQRVALAKEMAQKIDAALAIFEKEIEEGKEGEEDDQADGETEGDGQARDAQLSNDGDKWCAIQENLEKRRPAAMSNPAPIHPSESTASPAGTCPRRPRRARRGRFGPTVMRSRLSSGFLARTTAWPTKARTTSARTRRRALRWPTPSAPPSARRPATS